MIRMRTARLALREFVAGDAAAWHAYRADPRFVRYYAEDECTPAATEMHVERFLEWQRQVPRVNYQWVVERIGEGGLTGNCGLRRRTVGSRVADIGYELAPEAWGRGYASELAERMLAFGFDDLALHRVEAHCIRENVASARVLEKVGMRCEGVLREKEWIRGRWWDVGLYALLESEWRRT